MDAEPTPRLRLLRMVAAFAAVAIGLSIIVLATAFGHCSAFGGRCPANTRPLLDDDVFGSAFFGGLLAVGAPVWLVRPGWRRLGRALAVGLPAGLLIGLLARSAAAG